MARYADYLESDVTPGEVQRSGYAEYFAKNPLLTGQYLTAKKFKFQPTDKGGAFQNFLNLMSNPESIASKNIKLPAMYQLMNRLAEAGQ
jgi:hypothetical protein